jgi:hypothetical protein
MYFTPAELADFLREADREDAQDYRRETTNGAVRVKETEAEAVREVWPHLD